MKLPSTRWILGLLFLGFARGAEAAPAAQSCQVDLLAGYDGNGIRIHSTFQKTSDEFSQGSGVMIMMGNNGEQIPLTGGFGHLANNHSGVLRYAGDKTVLLVIDWPQGVVTGGSVNGSPIEPSLTNTVFCQPI